MTDEFANSAPPRLNASAKSSGWLEPLQTPGERQVSPHDERLAQAEVGVATAAAETERLKELVFVARETLARSQNGTREAAEAALADARRAWDVARAAEERARVRATTLGALRADWLRQRALEELGR